MNINEQRRIPAWLRSVLWSLLMASVTIVLCLIVAERFLGITGFVKSVEYGPNGGMEWLVDPHLKIGVWFRRIFLLVIPLVFYRKVPWPYTLIHPILYTAAYFPIREVIGVWPAMGFLAHGGGFLNIPPILTAIMMALYFWSAQSLVYLVCWLVRLFLKKRKEDLA